MKTSYATVVLVMTLILGGCASTDITAFKDPAFKTVTFRRILVVANTSDLGERQNIESRMVESFQKAGIFAMQSLELFPPTRSFSGEQKIELLKNAKLDAYISINIGESGVEQTYIPPTQSTTKTEGTVRVNDNSAQYKENSTTTTDGGRTLSKPWANFSTSLNDVSSGALVWIASSSTGGNAYATINTVRQSYCDKVVTQLRKDGLVEGYPWLLKP